MKADMARPGWVALCAILLAACTLLSPVQIATKKEVLSNIPLDLPAEKTRSATLLVLAPETRPSYDTTQMAYTTQAYQIAYFSEHEWAETPSQMVLPLIVATLRNTHYFQEVLPVPHVGRHTFVLRTEILELQQDFTSEPAMLRLTMRFSLNREATHQLIATKEVSLREPMRERNPSAGVVAANDATAKILRELARFVVEKAD
jgi:cholesterol transport system auxiliary component